MKINENHQIWYEKYRPQVVEDLILPAHYTKVFKEWISKPTHILLCSITPGTGKTSTMNALIRESGMESLFINASLDTGIDILRGKIMQFASTESLNGLKKVVVLDECLEESERIIILKDGVEVTKALKELSKNHPYDCISLNMDTGKIEEDTCEIVTDREAKLYEVELEDGRKIKVTSNHPFIIREGGRLVSKTIEEGLEVGDDVVCREEVSIPPYDGRMGVQNYLKKYNLKSPEEMYLKLHNMTTPPKCKFCENFAKFLGYNQGYHWHCGSEQHSETVKWEGIRKKNNKGEEYDNFLMNNKELYENISFPFKDPYDGRILRDYLNFSLRSYSRLKCFDETRECPYCGGKFRYNRFLAKRDYCGSHKCRAKKYPVVKPKLSFEEIALLLGLPKDTPPKLIKLIKSNEKLKKKTLGLLKTLSFEDIYSHLTGRLIFYKKYILRRKHKNHSYSFLRNNIIEKDMLNECQVCGEKYVRYDKIIKDKGEFLKPVAGEFACKKHFRELIKTEKSRFYPLKEETRLKLSLKIKEKIKEGEFTPPVTNSWTHWSYEYNGQKFRSSWELYYFVFNEDKGIDLEYEKIRIPYKHPKTGKEKNYIADFYNPRERVVIEIKPDSLQLDETNIRKFETARRFCSKYNLKFTIIGDEWFQKNYDERLLIKIPLKYRKHIQNSFKHFGGAA